MVLSYALRAPAMGQPLSPEPVWPRKLLERGSERWAPVLKVVHKPSRVSQAIASKGIPMGPWYGPLASLKGSEIWAPILKVVMLL